MFGRKKKEKSVSDSCSCEENKSVPSHSERACGTKSCSNRCGAKACGSRTKSCSGKACGGRTTKASSSARAEK